MTDAASDASVSCVPWDGGVSPDAATDAATDAADAGSSIALEDFRVEVERAMCDMIFRCPFPFIAAQGIPPRVSLHDPSQCRDIAARYITHRGFNDLVTAVGLGLVHYDAAAARACIDTLDQHCLMQPDNWFLDHPACRPVFQGVLPEDACCCNSMECAGQTYCSHGACRPFATAGTPCDQFTGPGCGAAGYAACVPADGGYRCVSRELTPEAHEGEPCGLVATIGDAEQWTNCAAGLWCTSRNGPGTCRRPIAAGATCGTTETPNGMYPGQTTVVLDECEAGFVCLGTCTSDAELLSQAAGDPCDLVKPNKNCNAYLGLACSCTNGGCQGTCDQRFTPGGAEGASCNSKDGRLACDGELTCSSAGQCIPFKANGEACASALECASGDCESTCVRGCRTWRFTKEILYP